MVYDFVVPAATAVELNFDGSSGIIRLLRDLSVREA